MDDIRSSDVRSGKIIPPPIAMFNTPSLSQTYAKSLIPFAGAYTAYVAADLIPVPGPEYNQLIKLVICVFILLNFRKSYHLPPLTLTGNLWALLGTPIALAVWVVPFWWLTDQSTAAGDAPFSMVYWALRTINSVFIISIAEELFIRGYLSEWFYQAGSKRPDTAAFLSAVRDTFYALPEKFTQVPISLWSFLGAGIFFTLGHSPKEYLSAALYYSVTHAVYYKTGSLTVVILIHALINLSIALMVKFGGLTFLWFG